MAKCLFNGSSGGIPKSLLEQITAGAGDVLADKVIVDANGNPLTGTIQSMGGQTITPKSAAQTVSCKGKYMTGDISVKGDSNLVANNILSGKSIFGVSGNVKKYGYTTTYRSSPSGSGSFRYVSDNGQNTLYYVQINNIGFTPTVFTANCYRSSNWYVTGYNYNSNVSMQTFVVSNRADYMANRLSASFTSSKIVAPLYSNGDANVYVAGYY